MIAQILVLLLVILLATPDSSMQTSVIWDRSLAWSPWLFKISIVSISDIFLLILSFYVLWNLIRYKYIPRTPYLLICLLAFVYLIVGLIYNLLVVTAWKTFLYDFKVWLLLTMPFLFLYYIKIENKEIVEKWISFNKVFFFVALASLMDVAIVYLFGNAEYPSFLGFPPMRLFFPIEVLVAGLLVLYDKKRWLCLVLLSFEMINAINRLALGLLYLTFTTYIYMLSLVKKMSLLHRIIIISLVIISVNTLSVFLMANPLGNILLAQKADGADTRQIQWENVLANFDQNIPGYFGKGLGSTWFVEIPLREADLYAVGTSMGEDGESSVTSSVQFIFNSTPPSLLYKWGVLGGLLLFASIAYYYNYYRNRIAIIENREIKESCYFVLLTSTLFIINNYTYIGLQWGSLITSVVAFLTHDMITKRIVHSEMNE